MSTLTDVVDTLKDLKIVATGSGFDVTLSDAQVARYRAMLRNSLILKLNPDGTPSNSGNGSTTSNPSTGVRITNLKKVVMPVAFEFAWTYLALGGLAFFILGRATK